MREREHYHHRIVDWLLWTLLFLLLSSACIVIFLVGSTLRW